MTGSTRRRTLLAGTTGGLAMAAPASVPALAQPAPAARLDFAGPEALEAAARAALPREVFDWIAGGAGAELALARNRAALEAALLVPRMLTGAGPADLSLDLLGARLASPVLVAPFGLHGVAHPRGELATAEGAAAAGALFCAPMVATMSLEAAARAGDGGGGGDAAPRWLQLYLHRDRGITLDLARRAEGAGYRALVLTLDAPVAAWRERDIANRFAAPAALGAGNDRPGYGAALIGGTDAEAGWEYVEWLRARTPLPLVLKGILSPADARRAVAAGAGAVVVSNHGGRQLDSAPSGFAMLPRVAAAVEGRLPLLVDGGFRRGEDVLKALAAGASAVALGRPVWWALALGGAEGVRSLLDRMAAELATAMRYCGCARLADITSALLDPG